MNAETNNIINFLKKKVISRTLNTEKSEKPTKLE